MFVFFLFILLINIIVALPKAEELSTISNVEKSSNQLQKAVHALQTAIEILIPKKKNLLINQQSSLLIRCLIHKDQMNEEQQKACKEFYNKNMEDKSEDISSEEKNTINNNDHLLIHTEDINEENDTEDENYFIKDNLNRQKINLDSISSSPLNQYWFNQSKSFNLNLNQKSKNNSNKGLFQWLSNSSPIKNAKNQLFGLRNSQQSPQLLSEHSVSESKIDDNDKDLKTVKILSRFHLNNSFIKNEQNPSFQLLGTNKDDDNHNEFDTSNLFKILTLKLFPRNLDTDLKNEKLKQQSKLDKLFHNIGRFANYSKQKHILLTNLTKTLEILESLVDQKGLDSDNEQISIKTSDLRSIIRSRKFSWKFLQFLNTFKNILDQSITNNQTNSIN